MITRKIVRKAHYKIGNEKLSKKLRLNFLEKWKKNSLEVFKAKFWLIEKVMARKKMNYDAKSQNDEWSLKINLFHKKEKICFLLETRSRMSQFSSVD